MPNGETNGRVWGISIDKWVVVIQSVGVPTLIILFLMWLAYSYIPPVVDGHLKLLERTSATLEAMERTLAQSNDILLEVNDVSQGTKRFMQEVCDDHEVADKKLDIIIKQTEP